MASSAAGVVKSRDRLRMSSEDEIYLTFIIGFVILVLLVVVFGSMSGAS